LTAGRLLVDARGGAASRRLLDKVGDMSGWLRAAVKGQLHDNRQWLGESYEIAVRKVDEVAFD